MSFALVYGDSYAKYAPGGHAVHFLQAKTREEAIEEAKLYLQGDPEEWYLDVCDGVVEFYNEGSGLLLNQETCPENSYVVEVFLGQPHVRWVEEAKTRRDAFIAAKQKEVDEEREREEYERLKQKFEE